MPCTELTDQFLTVPLAEAGAALAKWDENPAKVTKILVTVG